MRLSQWDCYHRYADFGRPKDLDFGFVSKVYGLRNDQCRYLRRKAGLQAFPQEARISCRAAGRRQECRRSCTGVRAEDAGLWCRILGRSTELHDSASDQASMGDCRHLPRSYRVGDEVQPGKLPSGVRSALPEVQASGFRERVM